MLASHCQNVPKNVRIILGASIENRSELEKVINHYKTSGNEEKLQAAYFLIGNIYNKCTIECNEILKYDPIFSIFDSLEKNHTPAQYNSPLMLAKWDSLLNIHGNPGYTDAEIIPDYSVIKADYLIENIDLAFQLREGSKWGKKIPFENFCEYVLPYRFGYEPIESWRLKFYNRFKFKVDSINADSCFQLASAIHKFIALANFDNIMMSYPYGFPLSKLDTVLKGDCYDVAIYNSATMRSVGLPVGIDYVPRSGTSSGSHAWNVLLLEDGRHFSFERKKDTLESSSYNRPPKVFRKAWSNQGITKKFKRAEKDVPDILLDNRIDVTHEYTKTYDIKIKLSIKPGSGKRYAVICSFNNKDWSPQDFGKIRFGKVTFRNMGSEMLYRPMYYDGYGLYPAGDPFILKEDGTLEYHETSLEKTEDMLLLRKYRFKELYYSYDMVGGYFEGANKADFSDAVKLFTISDTPMKIESAAITNSSKFRYVRYVSPGSATGNVAELWFYGGNSISDTLLLKGKIIGYPEVNKVIGTPFKNVFDNNLESFFDRFTSGLCWAGRDLGRPYYVTKIRYCPRSDTNFILKGDTYELCYWLNVDWVSFGTQVAKGQSVIFKDVPSGGFYILHNLTRGKEERIFTYENGKQVWW